MFNKELSVHGLNKNRTFRTTKMTLKKDVIKLRYHTSQILNIHIFQVPLSPNWQKYMNKYSSYIKQKNKSPFSHSVTKHEGCITQLRITKMTQKFDL